MNIVKNYRLPRMGCTIVHRTTREWELGASTEPREAAGANAKSLVGIAIGAGLWLLSLPIVRERIGTAVRTRLERLGIKPGEQPTNHPVP